MFSRHTANKGQGQESNVRPDAKFLAVNHAGAPNPGLFSPPLTQQIFLKHLLCDGPRSRCRAEAPTV